MYDIDIEVHYVSSWGGRHLVGKYHEHCCDKHSIPNAKVTSSGKCLTYHFPKKSQLKNQNRSPSPPLASTSFHWHMAFCDHMMCNVRAAKAHEHQEDENDEGLVSV